MEKRFFDYERYVKGNLKEGETFSIDSGMGGYFKLEFKGWTENEKGDIGIFKVVNEGWENLSYSFTPEEAAKKLFVFTK